MKEITIGSLFDGSGGFPLAAALYGCVPLWASEIEPYPIAVTRSRFPNMKHLGNVSEIHGGKIDPVDIITFGSPCQDMSIAGKRAGLKHVSAGDEVTTRSGLFYEAIRIIREMREATNGKYPSYAVWENVPGALTSNKGDDFRYVLEEFVRVKEKDVSIPQPPGGGWTTSGEIVGDGHSIAWRVLDAQYWGVPQRRRRIYLVADFTGGRAGKILFERESVSGNPAQSGETRKGAADDAERGTDGGHCSGCLNPWDSQSKRIFEPCGVYPTLTAMSGAGHSAEAVIYGTTQITSPVNGSNSHLGDPAVPHCYVSTRFAEYKESLPTLRASGGDCGGGSEGICVALDCRNLCANSISTTLQAKENGGYSLNYQNPVVYDARGNGDGRCIPTLTGDHENRVTDYTSIVCAATAQANSEIIEDVSPTLLAGHERPIVAYGSKPPRRYIVRRLTPTPECARLQGFPDCWGHPEHKDTMTDEEVAFWEGVRETHAKLNGKTYKPCKRIDALLKWYNKLHTDNSEYKMWGNGIAFPCAEFVLSGIVEELNNE